MWLLIGVAGLELLALMPGPLYDVLALKVSPSVAQTWAYRLIASMVIINVSLTLTGAWVSVREGDLLNQLAYVVGVGMALSHLIRRIDTYDALYVAVGGSGDITAEALILFLYLLLPIGIMLCPMLTLPFTLVREGLYYERVRRYFGGE